MQSFLQRQPRHPANHERLASDLANYGEFFASNTTLPRMFAAIETSEIQHLGLARQLQRFSSAPAVTFGGRAMVMKAAWTTPSCCANGQALDWCDAGNCKAKWTSD
jgi:hypothetical protein